jgi:hypothetical protein
MQLPEFYFGLGNKKIHPNFDGKFASKPATST